KMSKSLGNAIGITDQPSEMYGKLMSISDALMGRYYELLSAVDTARVQEIQAGTVHPMEAKKLLAAELVTRFHDQTAATQAAAEFTQRFQRRELPDEMEIFTWSGKESTVWICHLLRTAGLAKSTSEARRLVGQGGVKVDGERIEDADIQLPAQGEKVLQVGRRRVIRIVFPS
ncbi:MAG: tyrosine--tRNA ligase, partial [Egibacteraceae bacterium]